MPFGVKPQCSTCKTTISTMWRKGESGEVLCNGCALRGTHTSAVGTGTASSSSHDSGKNGSGNHNNSNNNNNSSSNNGGSTNGGQSSCPFTLRKSTRAKSSKFKQQTQFKTSTPKGKSRRIIFKKSATKAPTAVATIVTSDYVYHKGIYYQVGDIVSLVDVEGGVYYAQIRGLLQDQYCEKSAVITWLLPTRGSPKDYFDPATYILGPEEDIPRKLDFMEFVCHAPSDYYKATSGPYPTIPMKPESCFIWTRIGPQIKPLPTQEEVFGSA